MQESPGEESGNKLEHDQVRLQIDKCSRGEWAIDGKCKQSNGNNSNQNQCRKTGKRYEI